MTVDSEYRNHQIAVSDTAEKGAAAPMPAGAAEKIKVTVNLTPEDVETLNAIAAKRGVTKTEVLRRALAMEKFLDESADSGEKILLQSPDNSVRQLLIR